jgi:hypothetical protein
MGNISIEDIVDILISKTQANEIKWKIKKESEDVRKYEAVYKDEFKFRFRTSHNMLWHYFRYLYIEKAEGVWTHDNSPKWRDFYEVSNLKCLKRLQKCLEELPNANGGPVAEIYRGLSCTQTNP